MNVLASQRFLLLTLCEDMDKMVAVKGLVIRTTPIIPDMKEGIYTFPSSLLENCIYRH